MKKKRKEDKSERMKMRGKKEKSKIKSQMNTF